MAWVSIDGILVELIGDKGAQALKKLVQALEAVASDGISDADDAKQAIEALREFIDDAPGPIAQAISKVLEDNSETIETLDWLLTPTSEVAALAKEEDRKRSWSLLGWTPSDDVAVPNAVIKLGFDLDAEITLAIETGSGNLADQLFASVELKGKLEANAGVTLSTSLKFLDKASASAEASWMKSIEYEVPITRKTQRTGRSLAHVLSFAGSPPTDLNAVNKALSNGLARIVVNDVTSRTADGSLEASVPVFSSGVIVGGKLNVSASVTRTRNASTNCIVTRSNNDRVNLAVSRSSSTSAMRQAKLGLEVEIDAFSLVKNFDALFEDAIDDIKPIVKELAKATDLSDDIERVVGEKLKTAFGDGLFTKALEAGLFDDEETAAGVLTSKISELVKARAGVLLDKNKTPLRTALMDWVNRSPFKDFKLDDERVSDTVAKGFDDAIEELSSEIDTRIEAVAEHIVSESADLEAVLTAVGDTLTDNSIVNDIENVASKLKNALSKLSARLEKLRKQLKAVTQFTVGANYVSEVRRQSNTAGKAQLEFDPKSDEAGEHYRTAVFAPFSTASALVAEAQRPSGIDVLDFSEIIRLRRAAKRSFGLKLGKLSTSAGSLISSASQITRVGNSVYLQSAQEAEVWRKGFFSENQNVSASYLIADEIPTDTNGTIVDAPEQPASWVDEAASLDDPQAVPLVFTIHHEDAKDFSEREFSSFLSNFERSELLDDATVAGMIEYSKALRAQSKGKLKASIEAVMKVSNDQVEALTSYRNAEARLRTIHAEEVWAAMSRDEREDTSADISKYVRFEGEATTPDQIERRQQRAFVFFLERYDVRWLKKEADAASHGTSGTNRTKARRFYLEMQKIRKSADTLPGLLADLHFVADTNNKIPDRQARLESINATLFQWTKAAPQVLFSGQENVDLMPLAFMRIVRALCRKHDQTPAPDLMFTVQDSSSDEMQLFSDVFSQSDSAK